MAAFRSGPIEKRHGAYLPHWTAKDAHYFVTFRLVDSLPAPVVAAYRQERARMTAALRGEFAGRAELSLGDLRNLRKLFNDRIEHYLDAGQGACWMNDPRVAEAVQNALTFFHGQRYQLNACVVMPNHVHVVFKSDSRFELSTVLHSWKSFSAKEANKLLGRTGPFWQAEPYDHLVRDAADLRHCVDYTLANPEKAGLRAWRWVGSALDVSADG